MSPQIVQKQDLRERRTRMLLHKAFVELLNERSFQAITVQDIAGRAMVNRATFYDHFADKHALFEYSMREWFRQTLESKLPEHFGYCIENLHVLIMTVLDFMVEVVQHCRPSNKHLLPPFETQITALVGEIILGWLTSPENVGDAREPGLVADIASWAIYGAALHWSQAKHRDEPPASFARRAAPLITAILKH